MFFFYFWDEISPRRYLKNSSKGPKTSRKKYPVFFDAFMKNILFRLPNEPSVLPSILVGASAWYPGPGTLMLHMGRDYQSITKSNKSRKKPSSQLINKKNFVNLRTPFQTTNTTELQRINQMGTAPGLRK